MANGDLITDAYLLQTLPSMASTATNARASLISSSSRFLLVQIATALVATSFQEETEMGYNRLFRLRQKPVISIDRIDTDLSGVLTISYNGPAQRATVAYNNSLVTLTTNTMGSLITTTVSALTYPIVSQLAAAISAVPGWTGSVMGTAVNGNILCDAIRNMQGGISVIPTPATLHGWTATLNDFDLVDPLNGEVMIFQVRADTYRYPDQVWGANKRSTRMRISYTAGYSAIPDDLQQAAVSMCQFFLESTPTSGVISEERMGEYSYKMSNTNTLPIAVQMVLSNYAKEKRRFS